MFIGLVTSFPAFRVLGRYCIAGGSGHRGEGCLFFLSFTSWDPRFWREFAKWDGGIRSYFKYKYLHIIFFRIILLLNKIACSILTLWNVNQRFAAAYNYPYCPKSVIYMDHAHYSECHRYRTVFQAMCVYICIMYV